MSSIKSDNAARALVEESDTGSESGESWSSEDVEIGKFHEFLDELNSEIKEMERSEKELGTFNDNDVTEPGHSVPSSETEQGLLIEPSDNPGRPTNVHHLKDETGTQTTPWHRGTVHYGHSTLRPQVKDSPAQTDIVGGPAVPPPAETSRPPTDRPPPLVAKVFGKRAREEDPAVSAVDACCERMFWVLENFIQGRLQKTTDEQSARGCRCLEGETRSAMTEAKHWVGRLSMRFGLSLRDQLKTCHKAIQHTLLAWQAVFQRAQLVHCDRGVQCALAQLEGSSPVPAAPPAAQPARGHASAAAAPRQADLRTPWDQTTGYRTLKTLFEAAYGRPFLERLSSRSVDELMRTGGQRLAAMFTVVFGHKKSLNDSINKHLAEAQQWYEISSDGLRAELLTGFGEHLGPIGHAQPEFLPLNPFQIEINHSRKNDPLSESPPASVASERNVKSKKQKKRNRKRETQVATVKSHPLLPQPNLNPPVDLDLPHGEMEQGPMDWVPNVEMNGGYVGPNGPHYATDFVSTMERGPDNFGCPPEFRPPVRMAAPQIMNNRTLRCIYCDFGFPPPCEPPGHNDGDGIARLNCGHPAHQSPENMQPRFPGNFGHNRGAHGFGLRPNHPPRPVIPSSNPARQLTPRSDGPTHFFHPMNNHPPRFPSQDAFLPPRFERRHPAANWPPPAGSPFDTTRAPYYGASYPPVRTPGNYL
ncbi:hypothetical protein FJT64_018881 [Amphibalanus amphitrite]|uniref:Uncharacterized protein n=1 Tax=Amphibalanus amphitrite TaxID=1232801 RepID=A0A6A4X6P0_AMPAM|nr:uncharacterized protein LOC122390111 [Amphibalanus amphitrite]KAF0310061.1 hypothetical protein FJT64_018881 [Amphibalanus amphitrite]